MWYISCDNKSLYSVYVCVLPTCTSELLLFLQVWSNILLHVMQHVCCGCQLGVVHQWKSIVHVSYVKQNFIHVVYKITLASDIDWHGIYCTCLKFQEYSLHPWTYLWPDLQKPWHKSAFFKFYSLLHFFNLHTQGE